MSRRRRIMMRRKSWRKKRRSGSGGQGTVIEVKVTTQPQQQSGGGSGTAAKVHRSSVVINKRWKRREDQELPRWLHHDDGGGSSGCSGHVICGLRLVRKREPTATGMGWVRGGDDGGEDAVHDDIEGQTSKEELLRHMRRCNQLRRRPLSSGSLLHRHLILRPHQLIQFAGLR
ncbi:hypothetical protein ACMD2_26109 [Ananas comosus]|uniref:Uncharacterized protein n=1 Tax=Ananas comosus TaxID=4615 RepID=A0A199USE6_ANACO|nr:hypothetical protein ACMD2_26109 [Ananas comosus]